MKIKDYIKLQLTPKMIIVNILEIVGLFVGMAIISYIFTALKMMVYFN